MEFCQLQINYIDWTFQNGKEKVDLLNEYHIPVWVMEPLRGGRLARLSEQEAAPLKAMRPEETIPAWAFRFLQSIPSVTMILSGMSDMEQMKANIATFAEEKPLSAGEMEGLLEMAQGMVSKSALPCTACHYCVSHCPQGLDIPSLLALYNEHSFTGGGFIAPMVVSTIPKEKQPSACIGCRSCEAVCPQQLKISEAMAILQQTGRLRYGPIGFPSEKNTKTAGSGTSRCRPFSGHIFFVPFSPFPEKTLRVPIVCHVLCGKADAADFVRWISAVPSDFIPGNV